MTVTNGNCSSTSTIDITVTEQTNATISSIPVDPFCENADEITLIAATGGGTWSGTGITDANAGTFDPAIAGPGIHTISYDISGSCPGNDTRDIEVLPAPVIDFDSDVTSGCNPLEVRFNNNTPNSTSVTWEFGDAGTFTSTTQLDFVDHTYGTGVYDVTLTVESNGCISTETIAGMITVYPVPIAEFTATNSDGAGEYVFTNTSVNGDTYFWDFGDGETSTDENPSHDYGSNAGDYVVTLTTTSADGCSLTYSQTVSVEEGLVFFVPNTFTPNDDPANQYFTPVMTSGFDPTTYSLRIFNRWGELIFESNDINVGWDGTYLNEKLQTGIYSWEIRFRDLNTDEKYAQRGRVTLLR